MTEACVGKALSSCVAVMMGSDFDSTISPDDDSSDSRNIKIVALELYLDALVCSVSTKRVNISL